MKNSTLVELQKDCSVKQKKVCISLYRRYSWNNIFTFNPTIFLIFQIFFPDFFAVSFFFPTFAPDMKSFLKTDYWLIGYLKETLCLYLSCENLENFHHNTRGHGAFSTHSRGLLSLYLCYKVFQVPHMRDIGRISSTSFSF